jgi:hypothetical protein
MEYLDERLLVEQPIGSLYNVSIEWKLHVAAAPLLASFKAWGRASSLCSYLPGR